MAPRRQFYAPNTRTQNLNRWRSEARVRAIGALTCHGGLMSGAHLAALLGMSPRGLRVVIARDDLITVEIRQGKSGHGETWYRLNLAAMPPVPEPPPLRLEAPKEDRPTTRRLKLPPPAGNRGTVDPTQSRAG